MCVVPSSDSIKGTDTTGVEQTGTTSRTWARAVATGVRHTPTAAKSCRCGYRSDELRVVGCAPTYNHPVFSQTRVSTVLSTAAVIIFEKRNGNVRCA